MRLRGVPPLVLEPDEGAFPWQLDALSIRDGHFDFTDRTADPVAEVPVHVDRVELGAG